MRRPVRRRDLKSIIRGMFRKLGLEVRRYGRPYRDFEVGVRNLARLLDPYPKTVIDIGVAQGTPELYSAFPNVRFLLVEPMEELFRGPIEEITKRYPCTVE